MLAPVNRSTPPDMLLRIFSIIFPVFAIAAIGFAYGRHKRPDMALANQLNMDLFVPALVFGALSSKSFDLAAYQTLALAGAAVILGSGLIAWPFARWLKADYRTFVPPMMFNNSGNMGLPLVLLAFGDAALPAAIVLFIVEMTLHFSVGAYILDHRLRLTRLVRVPVIVATVLGLGFSAASWSLPDPVETVVAMLGDIAIPLLLFSLGVRLTEVSLRDWHLGVIGAVLGPAAGLAIVWAAGSILALPPQQLSVLIVFGALPPAVLNYIVAEQYGQEPEKVASIVMLGNLGSLVVIPVALAVALT